MASSHKPTAIVTIAAAKRSPPGIRAILRMPQRRMQPTTHHTTPANAKIDHTGSATRFGGNCAACLLE